MSDIQKVDICISLLDCDDIPEDFELPKFKKIKPNLTYSLEISYPFKVKPTYRIRTGKAGLGLTGLLEAILYCYVETFEQDFKTNCYQNWGHCIGDLFVEGISLDHKKKTITLCMGS